MDFVGKVALVTGGASGMGAESARRLGELGARVVIVDKRTAAAGVVAAQLGEALVVAGDVGAPGFAESAVEETVATFHGLDIVVNAAGVIVRSTAEGTSDEQWERIFRTNVDGVFRVSRAALPVLKTRPGSSIVNFGSVWGSVGAAGNAAYCATKGAVHQLTRAMALEVAGDGVRINAVAPGEIDTPMLRSERDRGLSSDVLDEIAASVPAGRLGLPEEVAAVVAFLASERASFITGAVVPVDAGYLAQ